MQNTGKIITLSCIGILAAGAITFSQLRYKICWNCSADDYFIRGSRYVCEENTSHRQTGLHFLEKSAELGNIQAELALAELYCNVLPAQYTAVAPEQKTCVTGDVIADQEKGLSYFRSVLKAVKNGEDTDLTTLNNLILLHAEGLVGTDAQEQNIAWLYEKAAAMGSFQAMTILGNRYQTNGQYDKALQWFIQAAENPKDFQSPLTVGDYYMYGKGSATDYEKAHDWYSKAFIRAQKSKTREESAARHQVKKLSVARLDVVARKLLETQGNKPQIAVHYSLQGGVKHFIIFAADHPEESIGEVINRDGNIYATFNENIRFSSLLPELEKDGFSSMNEGMYWILNGFAKSTNENSAEMAFDFVLTDS